MKRKFLCVLMVLCMVAAVLGGCGDSKDSGKKKIGISMPTKDLQRWNQDGDNMKQKFEAAGYEVDLQYASNEVQQQVNQIENMISSKCDILVIAAIEADSLGTALSTAKEKKIPVIAYDRLIMNTDAISYYASFDNYTVGVTQGKYLVEKLDLANAAGPFNIELVAGDPGDNNAGFFFQGAMDQLNPYIESGKLIVKSGQTDFATVATPGWASEKSQERMDAIIAAHYSDGSVLSAVMCSNDSTAQGVTTSLEANYTGTWPLITGQDCDIVSVQNMIAGKQAMSVFKDTRTLAAQVVTMVEAIVNGTEVPVNNTKDYNNGTGIIPSFLCDPVFADINNYESLLIDGGYYTKEQLNK